MRCVIICAGEYGEIDFKLSPSDFIIACDGGMDYAVKMGITPHMIMGDFDSVKGDIPPEIPVKRFTSEKDDSDSILAAYEGLKRGYTEFIFLFSLGNRLDHTIANLQALSLLEKYGATGTLIGVFETAFLAGKSRGIKAEYGANISVFAWGGDAEGVTLTGMKYPLKDYNLSCSYPIGLSNILNGEEGRIEVRSGNVLIIQSISNN